MRGRFWDLDLQGAFSKAETENFLHVVFHIGFKDHIVTSDAEIDVALPDERRDIRGRKKYPANVDQSLWSSRIFVDDSQCEIVVQREADIQTVVFSEFDICA